MDEWHKHLDSGKEVCDMLFNIRKAFDSIPHKALVDKLSGISLNSHFISWIRDYLTGRTQKVLVNGSTSTAMPVLSEVPQGSILGPLLFLIYISDISNIHLSVGSKLVLYADDMLLFKPISNSHAKSVAKFGVPLMTVCLLILV